MSARRNIIPVFVPHLGCPNECVFCNQRKISGRTPPADANQVRRIIDGAIKKQPGRKFELAFYGGSFTAIDTELQERLLGAAYEFIAAGNLETMRVSTRPDCIDAGKLDILKKFGVGTIELGIQSMDDSVLLRSKRGHTASEAVNAMRLVKAYGFKLIAQMMTGLPGDTPVKDAETARRIISEKPDGVRIYPTVVIKDTELFELYKRGEYEPQDIHGAAELCAELIEMFSEHKIDILRVGLNPSDGLSDAAVAGAYHPAFGELARSKLYLKKTEKALDGAKDIESLEIGVNPSCVSLMTGQKHCNISALKDKYKIKSISVKCIDIKPGEVEIKNIRPAARQ